jgi:hypothetical protein
MHPIARGELLASASSTIALLMAPLVSKLVFESPLSVRGPSGDGAS